jgi:phage gp29-like protein
MQVVAEQLDKMVQDAIAVIEDDQHIEPLDIGTRSASSDLYRDLIRHMNDEIAVAILGQTLTTEVREGSRAAAEVHMVVRDDIAAKDRHMVAGVMDRLIRWVWELNFQGPAPTWQWIEENDPQKVWAERDDLLSRQIRFSRVYYQRRYGLQDDEFDVPSLPSSPAPAKDSRAGMFAQSYAGRTNPGQTSIDAMGDAYVDRAAEMFGQAMDPVLTAVQQATSYNDMIERLYDVHKNMDTADFQELVRRAMFAADLWGYYRAHEEAGE